MNDKCREFRTKRLTRRLCKIQIDKYHVAFYSDNIDETNRMAMKRERMSERGK